jgi:hypothetical protein
MKKIGFLLAIIALVVTPSPLYASDYTNVRISEVFDGLSLDQSHQSMITYSETKKVDLQGQSYDFTTTAGLCEKPGEGKCITGVGVVSVLPLCESGSEKYCIENIYYEGAKARLIGYSPGKVIERDDKYVVARGASTSLWEAEDKSGTKHLIAARILLSSYTEWMSNGLPKIGSFSAQLAEVKLTGENYEGTSFEVRKDYYGMNQLYLTEKIYKPNCYVSFQGKCAEIVSKPGINLGAEIRISDLAASWFTGRMTKTKLSIKEGTHRVLSISGNVVMVPELEVPVLKTDLSDKPFYSRYPLGDNMAQTATDGLLLFGYLPEKYTQKSKVSKPLWSLKSAVGAQAGPCFMKKPGVGGFATTNAMVYNPGNPVVLDGEMIYLIGSTHLDEYGQENRGTYDLVLRSDVARCLYGLNPAPLKAEISVVSDDGKKQVATTAFGESDGWLYVGAYNFTYSSPKIKVKLTQAEMKTSIKCVKGKLKKTVSGVKPACPAGYKKVI